MAILCIACAQYSIFQENTTSSQNEVVGPLFTPAEPRGTIRITGDADLTSENGVRNPSAAGTESDPYVIADWIIDANYLESTCIQINDTRAHIVIRNCNLSKAEVGIRLQNATYIKVINVNITDLRGSNGPNGTDGQPPLPMPTNGKLGITSIGIAVYDCTNILLSSNHILNLVGGNGGRGGNGSVVLFVGVPVGVHAAHGGDGGRVYGILVERSNFTALQGNALSNMIGGDGGKGGLGANGISTSTATCPGTNGGNGGIGGNASGIAFEHCINCTCLTNTIRNVTGGDGGSGRQGGVGGPGTGSTPTYPGQKGGAGGYAGAGGLAAGISAMHSINQTLAENNITAIFGGQGNSGGKGGDGGPGQDSISYSTNGGSGGNGGVGSPGGASCGLYLLDVSFTLDTEATITDLSGGSGGKGGDGGNGGRGGIGTSTMKPGGKGGNGTNGGQGAPGMGISLTATLNINVTRGVVSEVFFGLGGSKGTKGTGGAGIPPGADGVDGNSGLSGTAYGFAIQSGIGSLIHFNSILCENNTDDGSLNQWDNGTIGNYWKYYTGSDTNDDGIGNIPFNIAGSASSQDRYPIWEDGDDLAPVVTLNAPEAQLFYGATAPSFDVLVIDRYLSHVWYTLDGGITNVWVTAFTGSLDQSLWDSLPDGSVIVLFFANDSAKHINYKSAWIYKDTTAPTSTISFTPSEGTNIVNQSTVFTLNATDMAGCGVQIIRYRIDNGIWTDYTRPFNLSAYDYGAHNVSYYAIDNLGNYEDANTLLVTLEAGGGPPQESPGSPIVLIAALVSIGAIAVVVLFLVRRYR